MCVSDKVGGHKSALQQVLSPSSRPDTLYGSLVSVQFYLYNPNLNNGHFKVLCILTVRTHSNTERAPTISLTCT